MSELIRCAKALVAGELREDFAFVVADGKIAAAGSYREVANAHKGDSVLETRAFPGDRIVVPGFVNGHSHAYQILLRGWADDLIFAKWRSDALYKVVPQLTPDDIYWVFVAAFSEMLAAGIATVAEFFYLNGAGNEHAEAAIRAARETGIRLILARTWMDADYAPPQFRESIDVAASRTLELMQRYPEAHVCVAPHSLHAASPDMIREAANFARAHDCALHVHVAEASYEGEETLAKHGATPINLLDQLRALNERAVVIHAIYVTDEEKDLIAKRGARVVHNPMTNQYLGDGICDVIGLQSRGVTVGLGTDADVKPSLIDEMRSATLLQKIRTTDGSALGAKTAFALGTSQGAAALRNSGKQSAPNTHDTALQGDFAAGAYADYLVLDARKIDPWSPAVNAVVYRAEDTWIQATYVNGKRVYSGQPSPLALHAREQTAVIAKRLL
jgi:5-methylthioadenosine/S-adenosylhomocysteine deaminase